MGRCERRKLPRKLSFVVKNHAPAMTSNVQGPCGFEIPTSGLKAHLFDPGFTKRAGSYWPVGMTIETLAPIIVSGFRSANSFGRSAFPPLKRVANLTRR